MNNVLSITNNSLLVGNDYKLTKRIVIPYIEECITNQHNIFVLDPDGELLQYSGKLISDNGYRIVAIDFSDERASNIWNPLLSPYYEYKSGHKKKCISLLYQIASCIMSENEKSAKADPFWENASSDYFVGLALILFGEATTEEQINLSNICRIARDGEQKFGGSTYIKEYVETMSDDPYGIKYILGTVLAAPSETRASIMSVFYQHLNVYYIYESVLNATSEDSIILEQLVNEKTAIFINYSADIYKDIPYLRLFLSFLSHTITHNKCSKYPLNYIFTDFLYLKYVANLDRIILANNSRGCYFLFVVDSFSNVQRIYNESYSDFLISACKDFVFMPTVELITLEKISKVFGVLDYDLTEQLLPYHLKNGQALLIIQSQKPRIIDTEDYPIVEPFVLNSYVKTNSKMVIINISEITREMKKQKLLRMMNEDKQQEIVSGSYPSRDDFLGGLLSEPRKVVNEMSVEGVEARIKKRIEDLMAEKKAKAGKKTIIGGGK